MPFAISFALYLVWAESVPSSSLIAIPAKQTKLFPWGAIFNQPFVKIGPRVMGQFSVVAAITIGVINGKEFVVGIPAAFAFATVEVNDFFS
jgi:hypothetical protein